MRVTIIAAAAALLFASTSAYAQFEGPGAPNVKTVAEAEKAAEDTRVTLTGRITAKVRSESYRFKDDTGELEAEIEEELWQGRKLTPDMPIRISGVVDREPWGVTVEVDSLEIIPTDTASKEGDVKKQ